MKNRVSRLIQVGAFSVATCVLLSVPSAAETVYTIDPQRSEFVVQLFKAGAGAVLAHDHVVRAATFNGRIRFDPAAPNMNTVTIEVPTASLHVDEAPVRQKYGLSSQLSEKDRQNIQETMMSASQLDVVRHPTMKFSSTKIETQRTDVYTITGDLTIRGITQKVTFPAQVEQPDNILRVRGSFRFAQSHFGYQPYSAFFGAVRNQDEVVLHFDILAVPWDVDKILR